jgi:hypothetical protein
VQKGNIVEWISVKDRLPEEWEQVLITGMSTSGAPLGVHLGELRDGWHFALSEDGGCDPNLDENVTHWMPLPTPPKE